MLKSVYEEAKLKDWSSEMVKYYLKNPKEFEKYQNKVSKTMPCDLVLVKALDWQKSGKFP